MTWRGLVDQRSAMRQESSSNCQFLVRSEAAYDHWLSLSVPLSLPGNLAINILINEASLVRGALLISARDSGSLMSLRFSR